MGTATKQATVVSTKGQVILPKAIRDSRRWQAGTRLTVEETEDGVLLRAAPIFAPTRPEDVYGCLKWDGPHLTIEDINKAIAEGIEERHARGRY